MGAGVNERIEKKGLPPPLQPRLQWWWGLCRYAFCLSTVTAKSRLLGVWLDAT